MKNLCLCIISIFVLLFIGCDAHTNTTVTVENTSSRELRVEFEPKPDSKDTRIYDPDEYIDADLGKGASTSFVLTVSGPRHVRNPNDEIRSVTISNTETEEIVKKLENNNNNIFTLISKGWDEASYRLTITDVLLD